MPPPENPEQMNATQIVFAQGQTAKMVEPAASTHVAEIVDALKLPEYREVIIVIGGAKTIDELDDQTKSRLTQLASRGILRAANATQAIIIDGGTDAGVMRLMGLAREGRSLKTALIGVAPRGAVSVPGDAPTADGVPLEPNHTHFVLVPGTQFGTESPVIVELAETLIKPKPAKSTPPGAEAIISPSNGAQSASQLPKAQSKTAVGPADEKSALEVLIGGNREGVAKTDVLLAVRRGFPIVVIAGSGGLADDIVQYLRDRPKFIEDSMLAEIIEDGNIHVFDEERPVAALEPLIANELGGNYNLDLAWRRFAAYDGQATRFQKESYGWQRWVLTLGVATVFAIALKMSVPVEYAKDGSVIVPGWLAGLPFESWVKTWLALIWDKGLYLAILVFPIITSGLVAYAARFNSAVRSVVFRAGAEAIRRAIFIYRTRPSSYRAKSEIAAPPAGQTSAQSKEEITREIELQRAIELVSTHVMQSEANSTGFDLFADSVPPGIEKQHEYGGAADDGMSFLTPEKYIRVRLNDQLSFYRSRSVRMEKELRRWQTLSLVAGGLGTLLAALGAQIWVAVATAFASACVTFLEYRQTRMTLMQYNQAATSLENIKQWWHALSPEDKADSTFVKRLVETTEEITATEQTGWAQQMHDALARLRDKQEKKESGPMARQDPEPLPSTPQPGVGDGHASQVQP
ncbi:MAG: SLATT domain-containing protein [Acidobacteriota bacterium]